MRVIRDFSACPKACTGATLALGNFDGIHIGHREILKRCIDTARQAKTPSAVMTFEPHPREFFARDGKKLRICSLRQKLQLLSGMGIDLLFLVRFNERFAANSAEAFVSDILVRRLAVRHVITGYNFAFGKGRKGNTAFLTEAARASGFGFTACPPVHDASGESVSSSAIRELLAAGDIERASALLGRPYEISGHVRHGDKQGRALGFPTANLCIDDLFKPRFGIYAVRVCWDGKRWHDAVASLGVRPTFDNRKPLLEVYIFDTDENLYGRRLQVRFTAFMRDEIRFDNLDTLRRQIEDDCAQARGILQKRGAV